MERWKAIEHPAVPLQAHECVQKWILSMPEVSARLEGGGNALDVGCGSGRVSIAIARGFPGARVLGFDLNLPSIECARANARRAGLEERVQFEVADGQYLPRDQFDFISMFGGLRDAADGAALLASIRRALHPGGTTLLLGEAGLPGLGALAYAAGFTRLRRLEQTDLFGALYALQP